MRYQSLALLSALTVSVAAVPTKIAKRDWINDEKGNIKLTFSDELVQIGDIKIDDIISQLNSACSTQGQCETLGFSLNGQLIQAGQGGTVNDIEVTVKPDGSYPTWIHNGLIDALGAAVKSVADCKDISHTSDCPNPMVYCPAKTTHSTQCTVPKYWGINYQSPDAPNAAPPNIQSTLDLKKDTDGFCSTFTTVGGAVAGAVNGAAGGIFTLIGLGCSS